MTRISFPRDFLWGAATSAYQIEGSPLEDGACPSIWHNFSHTRGKIKDRTNGDLTCDHYHRYAEDVRLMKDMGLKAYRFSIAWPRIFPEDGRINPKGLDFYSHLIDLLLESGVEPFPTLFHWDVPEWLEREGGFRSRVSVDRFASYGAAVISRLGDRVKSWITINEPSIFSFLGYATGDFAPGRRNDVSGLYHASHHLLLAHARLAEAFPSLVPGGKIGMAHHFIWISAHDAGRGGDQRAAAFMDDGANRFYMDPLFSGRYPERVISRMGRFLPKGFEKDLPGMKRPGDFIGINYYTRNVYRHAPLTFFTRAKEVMDPRAPRSAMWEIYPQGLHGALERLKEEYGNPSCFITENGFPIPDAAGVDPHDDPQRISYLKDHVSVVGRAIEAGVDCRGYFYWSLLDNWEWDKGFAMRFGLVRVDFATQQRTWKKSASWYRDLIRDNALEAESGPPAGPSGGK